MSSTCLNSVLEGFKATGICDKRLNEHSELKRGCGGVAILWRSTWNASPLPLRCSSDRICGVTIPLSHSSKSVNRITMLSVYCPSADADLNSFVQCITDLEEEVNHLDSDTDALIIAGDFNAHLGPLAGSRGSGPTNIRGITVKEFIDRNNLYVAFHGQLSNGPPPHTTQATGSPL